MDTLVRIKNTSAGKKLLDLLKTMSYVEVLSDNHRTINVDELKARIARAEKGKFYSIEESMQRTAQWKKEK